VKECFITEQLRKWTKLFRNETVILTTFSELCFQRKTAYLFITVLIHLFTLLYVVLIVKTTWY
jgi:hypothetical protein